MLLDARAQVALFGLAVVGGGRLDELPEGRPGVGVDLRERVLHLAAHLQYGVSFEECVDRPFHERVGRQRPRRTDRSARDGQERRTELPEEHRVASGPAQRRFERRGSGVEAHAARERREERARVGLDEGTDPTRGKPPQEGIGDALHHRSLRVRGVAPDDHEREQPVPLRVRAEHAEEALDPLDDAPTAPVREQEVVLVERKPRWTSRLRALRERLVEPIQGVRRRASLRAELGQDRGTETVERAQRQALDVDPDRALLVAPPRGVPVDRLARVAERGGLADLAQTEAPQRPTTMDLLRDLHPFTPARVEHSAGDRDWISFVENILSPERCENLAPLVRAPLIQIVLVDPPPRQPLGFVMEQR